MSESPGLSEGVIGAPGRVGILPAVPGMLSEAGKLKALPESLRDFAASYETDFPAFFPEARLWQRVNKMAAHKGRTIEAVASIQSHIAELRLILAPQRHAHQRIHLRILLTPGKHCG